MPQEEIHVLLVSFAAQGHINPMLRLAKRFISKGLHVTLATTEIARKRMLKTTTTTATPTSIAGIHLEFFSDGLSLEYNRDIDANQDYFMHMLRTYGPVNLSNLIHSIKDRKFSCIVNNPFLPWVADVAIEHGIPCSMLWIQPCTLYAVYYRFYNQLNRFPTTENPNLIVELPGLPLLKPDDLPSFVLPSNPFGSFPKLFSEAFLNIKKLKWVLANSFDELEKDVIDSMSKLHQVIPVGPLIPPSLLGEEEKTDIGVDMWKPEETCIQWLDQQPNSSVIYVSFGSFFVLSKKQMENIANALKNSKCQFLWVVKPPEHPSSDGSGELPLGFLEETEKTKGLVVGWCNQKVVLSHPAIAGFLSHCGWSSTLETIATGVPVIAYPQWTDQPTNAKLITDVFGIGVRLVPDQDGVVAEEELKRCIAEIMGGDKAEEYKKRAAELKRLAREAVADGGSSDRNIQMFVDDIIGNHKAVLVPKK